MYTNVACAIEHIFFNLYLESNFKKVKILNFYWISSYKFNLKFNFSRTLGLKIMKPPPYNHIHWVCQQYQECVPISIS
jgi:hypothetical protein